ncbi:MAG: hypothetical protein BJ554DRAFT_4785, partial [Olpidium bornovanus]
VLTVGAVLLTTAFDKAYVAGAVNVIGVVAALTLLAANTRRRRSWLIAVPTPSRLCLGDHAAFATVFLLGVAYHAALLTKIVSLPVAFENTVSIVGSAGCRGPRTPPGSGEREVQPLSTGDIRLDRGGDGCRVRHRRRFSVHEAGAADSVGARKSKDLAAEKRYKRSSGPGAAPRLRGGGARSAAEKRFGGRRPQAGRRGEREHGPARAWLLVPRPAPGVRDNGAGGGGAVPAPAGHQPRAERLHRSRGPASVAPGVRDSGAGGTGAAPAPAGHQPRAERLHRSRDPASAAPG